MSYLSIKNLRVSINQKEILRGLNLDIDEGQVHFIMGPNGSGKSALALALAGHPFYKIESGKITFRGKDITKAPVEKKAQSGLFVAFQNPPEAEGVGLFHFLRESAMAVHGKVGSLVMFRDNFRENLEQVGLPDSFSERYLNFGFSGGERKKSEILQLLTLKPKLAVLDEIDSGLDIDSLKRITKVLVHMKNQGTTLLVITHFERIAKYLKPDRIHILAGGEIVHSGQAILIKEIEKKGYSHFIHA